LSRLGVKRGKRVQVEAVPTSVGRAHVLVGGQARGAGWGAAPRASERGLASERPGASHSHRLLLIRVQMAYNIEKPGLTWIIGLQ